MNEKTDSERVQRFLDDIESEARRIKEEEIKSVTRTHAANILANVILIREELSMLVNPHIPVELPASPDNWIPANGGTEQPFISRSGVRLLYVWQPSSGRHAYLNLDTDIILTDAEAEQALGKY